MTVLMKESLRHAVALLGVVLLMSAAWTQGFSSAQTLAARWTMGKPAHAEFSRLREENAALSKQLEAAKDLIERYDEALSDGLTARHGSAVGSANQGGGVK